MKIGIMIAIERELKAFLENGSEVTEMIVGKRKIYRTEMYGHELYAVQSGYGPIDAAAGTQLLITATECEIVMNFGVVGAIVPGLKVEELFLAKAVTHYDYDVSPIDPVKPRQYEEFEDEFMPLDEGLIRHVKRVKPDIREVNVASGGRFVEKREDKENLAAMGCQIVDMELAAIARICFLNQVKCLSIKCISDTYEGDGGDFNANVIRSANVAFEVIRSVLQSL